MKILFDLDDPGDLANNYSVNILKEVLLIIQELEFEVDENIDVLGVIRAYLDGAKIEVNQSNEFWRKYIPDCIKKTVTAKMTLLQVYELVQVHVKKYERDSKNYMALMDFKCDLEEMIYSPEEFNIQKETVFDFELNSTIRNAVDAIMLQRAEIERLIAEEIVKLYWTNL